MMKRQDPTFRARENEETGQTLISGMGELHLEVIKHRLLRDYQLNVRVHKPRVSYRETIAKAVEVDRRVPSQHRRADACRRAQHPHGAESDRLAKPIVTLAPAENPLPETLPGGRHGSARRAWRRAAARWASR